MVNLDIPLRFATAGLNFTDTLDVNLTSDQFQLRTLTIPVVSTFPVALSIGLETESGLWLANGMTVPSATVDANGNVVSSTETVLHISLSDEQWSAVKQSQRLILHAEAITPNYPTPVYFTSANYLEVKIIAGADITAVVH